MKAFPSLLFSLATTALSYGAHRAVARWAMRSLPGVARQRRALLVACAVISVIPSVSRFVLLETRSAFADAVLSAAMIELMFTLAIAIPLLVVGWLARVGAPKASARVEHAADRAPDPDPDPAPAPEVGRRRAIEAIGGAAVVGTTGLVLGWGATVGRHDYQVREVPVRIPGLPRALDGYTIVQISDIHAGLFAAEREFAAGAALIKRIRPDLVVATGDLVDFDARHASPLARMLADLRPRDGVFAILGNHDYYAGADEVAAIVRAAGVPVLVNEGRILRPGDGGGFALLGIDDQWSYRYGGPGPDLAAATATIPRDMPRILLAHQPHAFEDCAGQVALQLSGHTHGGQIQPASLFMRGYVAGRYERDGSTLYVNRGFGVAGPPARVGVPPEITKVILVAT